MTKEKTSTEAGLVGGATALLAGRAATPRLLGYHVVRHGTSHDSARKIKETGFDPKMGGTGAGLHAAGSEARQEHFIRNSRGKVHVTKSPRVSRFFAAATESHSTKARNLLKGRVLKARITDSHWKSMKRDKDLGPLSTKEMGATTHHRIPASQVIGSRHSKGISAVVNKNTLRRYYGSSEGRVRALKGAALALLAAKGAQVAYSAAKNKVKS